MASGKTLETLLALLDFSLDHNPLFLPPLCRIINNMLFTNNSEIMIKFISLNLLDIYQKFLSKGISKLSKELLWGLSNIACHSEEMIDHLVHHKIFRLVQLLMSSTNLILKREALITVGNVLTEWTPLKVH